MPGLYSHTNRSTGTILTANIYNTDHQNHIDNSIPTMIDDYSSNVTQMRATVDPGENGSENFATSLAGELERLRHAILEIKQTMGISDPTYWYETKDEIDFAKCNIAGATKGDLITRGATAFGRRAIGADGTVLTADSAQPDGMRWAPLPPTPTQVPIGSPIPYAGHTLPDNYLWCDGSAISRTTYSALFAVLVKSSTVTADAGTDRITWTNHGLKDYWPVKFLNSGGSLPGGISSGVTYWIRDAAANDFRISRYPNGPAIDITSAGTGTHTAIFAPFGDGDGSTTFNVPAMMGRAPVGHGVGVVSEVLGSVDVSNNTFQVAANTNKWITGMPVVFTTTGTAPGGLVSGNTYYVIRINTTTIALANALSNAQNGVAIDITSAGTGTHTITYTTTARGLGEIGGEENHAQTSNELLRHTHYLPINYSSQEYSNVPLYTDQISYAFSGISVSSSGGYSAMNIMQPWVGMNWIIRYQ